MSDRLFCSITVRLSDRNVAAKSKAWQHRVILLHQNTRTSIRPYRIFAIRLLFAPQYIGSQNNGGWWGGGWLLAERVNQFKTKSTHRGIDTDT